MLKLPVRLGCLLVSSSWLFTASLSAQATPPVTPSEIDAGPDAAIPDAAPTEAAAAPAYEVEPAPSAEVSVSAEAEAETPAEALAASPEELVVTGSRIKRSPELARAAPVEILDRKQLDRSGATNTADIIQHLTPAQGSGFQGGGSPLAQGGGATGAAMINLRGLGAGNTLVLINGRRLVPSGGGGTENFADISVIPLSAVERIEVLKGGGSAIYGADAVGGVVNIITRGSWDGVRLEVDGQATTRFDQRDLTASGAWGAKSERSRVMLAASYLHRNELTANTRDFSRAANVDANGNPGTFIAPGLDPATPSRTRFPDPACDSVSGSRVVPTIANGMPTGDESCSFSFARFYPLLAFVERANVFGSAAYDVTNHTSVFVEALANRTRWANSLAPSYAVPPPLLSIPADHVDNPFGRSVGFVGRPLGAAYGAQHNTGGDDTFRIVGGARGDLAGVAKDSVFEDWEWELYASWGVSRYQALYPDSLRSELQTAINSCSDPSELSNCFNPFHSAVDGTGTPNSQAVIDRFSGTLTSLTDHALQTYNAGMSGSLFELPGGNAGIAFGAELRHEWRNAQTDHDANQERYSFLLGASDARAERNIYSGYVELRWPLYDGIELQTAARIEHYSDIDETTPSPFAGLTLVPAEIVGFDEVSPWLHRLQLTGQVTSAFRSPSLYQAYPGFTVLPTLLSVPQQPVPVYLPVQGFGNPALEPETALIASGGLTWQPIDELTLMAELWHYDYQNRIALESAPQAVANDAMLMARGRSDPRVVRDPMTGIVERVQVTQRNIEGHVTTNGLDFSAVVTLTGKTFGGGVQDWGALSFGATGTHTLGYRFPRAQAARRTVPGVVPPRSLDPLHCDRTSCQAAGSRNYTSFAPPLPRWRINLPVHWSFDSHNVTAIGHFTSGIENDNDVRADGSLGRLSSILTLDLQYGYTLRDWFGEELSVRIGFYNVFDTLPPATRDTNGYETLLYDPRGRMVYAKLSSSF